MTEISNPSPDVPLQTPSAVEDAAISQESKELDLTKLLTSISGDLGIEPAPRIDWDKSDQKRFIARYVPKDNVIFVKPGHPQEVVYELVVHELTHVVLWKAGYRSVGHSWIFMALFDLLMRRLGFEGHFVEFCASTNWNRTCTWPIWLRHVSLANELSRKIGADHSSLAGASAATLCQKVLDHQDQRRPVAFLQARWHNVIADTRGNWYALAYMSVAVLALGFLLLALQVPMLFHLGLWLCVVSGAVLFLVLKLVVLNEHGRGVSGSPRGEPNLS